MIQLFQTVNILMILKAIVLMWDHTNILIYDNDIEAIGHMPYQTLSNNPDNKVYGANMGPIWGQQGPGGPHVGPMNLAIWVYQYHACWSRL